MKRVAITGIRQPIIFDKQHDCPFERPFGYIYRVTNNINGHMYIGKHAYNKPELDKSYHGSGIRLNKAYEKYGMENFTMEILEWVETNDDDLNEAEIKWIDVFDTYHNPEHYNMTTGGDGFGSGSDNPMFGKTHSEEFRRKMSDRVSGTSNPNYGKTGKDAPMYGKLQSEETKKLLSYLHSGEGNPMHGRKHSEETLKVLSELNSGSNNSMYGKTHSKESRRKISEANLGKCMSIESRLKISKSMTGINNPMFGKTHSDETKQLLRELNLGRSLSDETKMKISEANTGRKHSEDAKRKISYSKRGENHPASRKVVQLDKELNLIREYVCVSDTKKYGFTDRYVSDTCKGKRITYKGFVWMYKEDYEAMLQKQIEAQ